MSEGARVPAAAALPVHMAQAVTGEAPFWHADTGTLWWIDIQGQRLLGFAPGTGAASAHPLPSMPGFVTGLGGDGERGRLAVGLEDGVHAFHPGRGLGERIAAVEADDPRTRLNDGKADARGRLWFGTMDKTGAGEPIGALYRLDLDGSLHAARTRVRVPNAIAFSPDGGLMYFADSRTGFVEVAPYDLRAGTRGEGRVFVRYGDGEAPDGACVDAEGGVWIAVVGGSRVERRRPDGALDLTVELPVSRPTMPMLGGTDGRTLFVTSQRRFLGADALAREPLAGSLLAVRVPHAAGPVHDARPPRPAPGAA